MSLVSLVSLCPPSQICCPSIVQSNVRRVTRVTGSPPHGRPADALHRCMVDRETCSRAAAWRTDSPSTACRRSSGTGSTGRPSRRPAARTLARPALTRS
jgi:hypothetical protein